MFKHILVPLDGSPIAEQALPVAARIARTMHSTLVLLEIINPLDTMGVSMLHLQEQSILETERQYLQNTALSPELAGIEVKIQACIGIPAEQILLAAEKAPIDLIVMRSHGLTGLKRWAMGSVAQKISRSSPVPILILQEDEQLLHQVRTPEARPVHIMVALDGSALAETALTPAAYLCDALSAPARGTLQLVYVMHLPSCFEYGQEDNVFKALKKETPLAQTYLNSVQQRLQEGKLSSLHLEITTTLTHDLDIAAQLLKLAEQEKKQAGNNYCQLIALTTHGRSGLQRWITGSVTERILSTACISVLVVRPAPEQ